MQRQFDRFRRCVCALNRMRVYVHCGAGLRMPQASRYSLHIDPLPDPKRSICVPGAVEAHLAQLIPLLNRFQPVQRDIGWHIWSSPSEKPKHSVVIRIHTAVTTAGVLQAALTGGSYSAARPPTTTRLRTSSWRSSSGRCRWSLTPIGTRTPTPQRKYSSWTSSKKNVACNNQKIHWLFSAYFVIYLHIMCFCGVVWCERYESRPSNH